MALSKKHYQEIAKIINAESYDNLVIKDLLVQSLCDYFKQDNPKFDKQSFIDACNREEEEQ